MPAPTFEIPFGRVRSHLHAAAGYVENQRPMLLAAVIFALAMVVRLILLFVLRGYDNPLRAEPVYVAMSLVNEHVFGSPFGVQTGPTAHLAPGYPFLLALIYGCFGFGTAGAIVRSILSIGACSLQYALLPRLAISCGIRTSAGFLAGVLGAAVPVFTWWESDGCFETTYVGAMLAGILILSAMLFRGARVSAWLYGAAWGSIFLFAPVSATIFASFLALWWWEKRHTIAVLKIVAAAALVVLPWMVRNYNQLGAVFWIRDNFGLELHVSNNPRARPLAVDNLRPGSDHPYDSKVEAARLKSMGEVEYYRDRGAKAMTWIHANPKRFGEITAARMWYFWFPKLKRWPQTLFAGVTTLMSVLGLWTARRNRLTVAWRLLGTVWLIYPLPYYLVQADSRYRYPIYSFGIVLACFWAAQVLLGRGSSAPER
jgi:hypothetical protein